MNIQLLSYLSLLNMRIKRLGNNETTELLKSAVSTICTTVFKNNERETGDLAVQLY